jgi:hypothetical protein
MTVQEIQAQIDKEQAIARKALAEKTKEIHKRFELEHQALFGKGVPFKILNLDVELKFTVRSLAWLEVNGYHTTENKIAQGHMLAMASTLHDSRVDWDALVAHGYQITEEFALAVREAFELSAPLEPLTPVDARTKTMAMSKPKPGGFGIDYAGMLLFVARHFGWTEEQFWSMTPRAVAVMMDKYNMAEYERAKEEKYQMNRRKRG